MIELDIPGLGNLLLQHLVLDVNGTLAVDGRLIEKPLRIVASLRK